MKKTEEKINELEKIKTETQKQEFERVEGVMTVTDIKVITPKDKDEVRQIRMKHSKGEITHKPRKQEEEKDKFKGLDLIRRSSELITLDELPQKVFDINTSINENGECILSGEHTKMNTKDREGKAVSYLFYNLNQFNDLIVE